MDTVQISFYEISVPVFLSQRYSTRELISTIEHFQDEKERLVTIALTFDFETGNEVDKEMLAL